MDFTYFIVAVVYGCTGFFGARAFSRFRSTREAAARVELGRLDGYALSGADALDLAVSGTDGDGHSHTDGPGYYLARQREAGRRAVPGPVLGTRPARDTGRRSSHRADETSVGMWPSDR